jgi:hypothetical protein
MDRFLRAVIDAPVFPNREHYLLISDSKHLFFSGEYETVKYQKKELDPRTCGKRTILTRYVVVDVATGALYAEAWPRGEEIDLAGFLVRAWAKKRDHPMKGAPRLLGIPAAVNKNEGQMREIRFVCDRTGTHLSDIESGFGAGTVALREYERIISSNVHESPTLDALLRCANMLSYVASGRASDLYTKQWEQVTPLTEEFLSQMDAAYDQPNYWRRAPFDRFIIR